MATQTGKTGPEVFVGDQSPENLRSKFIDAPLAGAQQSILASGLELANLLGILPDAFLASQNRELERVKKAGKENDPRVAMLQESIEQASVLKITAQRGQARIQRVIAASTGNENLFHGFVSDEELAPLKGLTVRLLDNSKTPSGKTLTATTDDDGYFRIPLDTKSPAPPGKKAKTDQLNLSQRINSLFPAAGGGVSNVAPPPGSTVPSSQDDGQVEILKKGNVIHRDPTLVARGAGSVYREYVIAADKSSSASDSGDRVSARKSASQKKSVGSSEPAAESSDASASPSESKSATAPDSKAQSPSRKASQKSADDAGSTKKATKK